MFLYKKQCYFHFGTRKNGYRNRKGRGKMNSTQVGVFDWSERGKGMPHLSFVQS